MFSKSYQVEILPSCTSHVYILQDVGSGPQYGLVGTGLGRLAFYYQCLSCGWDCRSWHDATCVGTGVPDDPQRPIRIIGKHRFATAWRRRHSRHQCLHSAGSPWQPLWPTCSLRPIVPTKLAAKNKRGEFIEMAELLPGCWSSMWEDDHSKQETKSQRACSVQDIFTWLQCYCLYMSGLGPQHPSRIPELMAH